MKKIKVAFICHFSNQEIRSALPLSSNKFINIIKKFLGKKLLGYADFAPWITILINEFEKFDNIELHVISPHVGLKRQLFKFSSKGIQYYFFRPDFSFYKVYLSRLYSNHSSLGFLKNRKIVSGVVNHIKPDIINLFGSENPYYSITALDIDKIPILVLLQAVLSTPFKEKYNFKVENNRLEVEKKIFEKCNYFGTASRMYSDCVLALNPSAKIFDFWFPTPQPPKIVTQLVLYDFVFFAKSVSRIKGVEDTIDALYLVSKVQRNVKLNIVGSCENSYKLSLIKRINELGLENNIEFHEYFPEHKDMFVQVKKSKIAVLPNKLDVLSSTIREAMCLEIPVVTTRTTGTPYLNMNNQTVLLSEIGDIEVLANNMLRLLNEPKLRKQLVTNARILVEQVFDNAAIAKKLLIGNFSIINHYKHDINIPKDLLFNSENYPDY